MTASITTLETPQRADSPPHPEACEVTQLNTARGPLRHSPSRMLTTALRSPAGVGREDLVRISGLTVKQSLLILGEINALPGYKIAVALEADKIVYRLVVREPAC